MKTPQKTKTEPKTSYAAVLVAAVFTLTGATTAFGITINTVAIGSPGNAGDTRKMQYDGGTYGYGSVPYTYEIGKTEVTSGQYAEFLNAVASTSDSYGLYDPNMANTSESYYGCGITRAGSEGNWSYTATDPKKPVNYVSVYDAMRFTNWLTNGATSGADTETGVYTLSGGSAIPSNPTVGRNLLVNGATLTLTGDLAGVTGTVWALPSEDEWYKAAYYSVTDSSYSLYPNGSDSISDDDANYRGSSGDVKGLMDVGKLSKEQNGTYDMVGNVWEWNDTLITEFDGDISAYNARGARGGAFNDSNSTTNLASSGRSYSLGGFGSRGLGFRVVSLSILTAVPEPGTYAAVMGVMILVIGMWARRGRRPL